MRLCPDQEQSHLVEYNHNHRPAGPGGGQFDHSSGHGPLSVFPHDPASLRIPGYLKKDVAAAALAGISVFHAQQPEPVRDMSGKMHDPLAKSHVSLSDGSTPDTNGIRAYHRARIALMTRGGEFEPEHVVSTDKWGFHQSRERKPYTPDDLKPEDRASRTDVLSTFRHEVGHFMRQRTYRAGTNTPYQMANEITAWQYAVEMSPNHRVSEKMVRLGLMSHAYSVFRGEALAKGKLKGYSSWDMDKMVGINLHAELERGEIDHESMAKAKGMTDRVVTALQNYGRVLRKRGAPAAEPVFRPWYDKNKIFPRDLGVGGRGTL